jgi:hypothetical protein
MITPGQRFCDVADMHHIDTDNAKRRLTAGPVTVLGPLRPPHKDHPMKTFLLTGAAALAFTAAAHAAQPQALSPEQLFAEGVDARVKLEAARAALSVEGKRGFDYYRRHRPADEDAPEVDCRGGADYDADIDPGFYKG